MGIRLAKYLSDSSVASRRYAEDLIRAGRICVNGVVVDTPVYFVEEGDVVTLDGNEIAPRNTTDVYMFHKPINTMTTLRDPDGRKTIYDCLPDSFRNLKYVGRLDFKTTGLLLLTNDGDLARRLTLPSSHIPRTYIATVDSIDSVGIARARRGITVDGIRYAPMDITVLDSSNLRVTICEGKKNEVRIVLRSCGCPVRKLHRVSFGDILLGNLPVGKICKLSQKTIDAMLKNF
jgi:23S rRNA pseudouridine2605 synthase